MALDDLDLEFEDEEEAKRKKNEAVQVDVDLEFQVPDTGVRPKAARPLPAAPAPAASADTRSPVAPRTGAEVKKIEDIRAQAQIKRPVAAAPVQTPVSQGSAAVKAVPVPQPQEFTEYEAEEVVALREKMRQTEFDAQVRVQVAEFKTEILSELNGDMKLMEHQINQLLVRMNAKHPDLKQEALMIKKILADFTAKKRK